MGTGHSVEHHVPRGASQLCASDMENRQMHAARAANINLTQVPFDYLQSYPYPALVLIHDLESTDGTAPTPIPDLEPLTPLWTNPAWKRYAGSRTLTETLSAECLLRLDTWLSRRTPSESPSRDELKVRTTGTLDGNPHGVVNGHLDEHLKKLAIEREQERGDDSPGPSHSPPLLCDPPPPIDDSPLVLNCSMGIPMSLAKTVFPVSVCPPHQLRMSLPNQALMVVTTMPTPPVSYTLPSPSMQSVQFTEPKRTDSAASSNDGNCSTPATSVYSRDENDVRQLLDSMDWAQTGLGPKKDWPWVLNLLTSFAMHSPLAISLWWGRDLNVIYNRAYSEKLMSHPKPFGQPGEPTWHKLWPTLPPIRDAMEGDPFIIQDNPEFSHSDGQTREWYCTHTFLPLSLEDGGVLGFHQVDDTTERVIGARRAEILRSLSVSGGARTMEDFDTVTLGLLQDHPKDIPFMIAYHVDERGYRNAPYAGDDRKVMLKFRGSIGVPKGDPSAPDLIEVTMLPKLPEQIASDAFQTPQLPRARNGSFDRASGPSTPIGELDTPDPDVPWPFREVLQTARSVLVPDCSEIIKGYPIRVWDSLPRSAVVVPLKRDGPGRTPKGIMVIGLSNHLRYDKAYEQFIDDFRQQITAYYASSSAHSAETSRRMELAAIDRAKNLFFSSVSHELFTPLSLISGPLDDALLDMPKGRMRDNLEISQRNVRRLSRLVSMLMDMSNLEAKQTKGLIAFHQVNLGEFVKSVASMFQKAAENAEIKLNLDDIDTTPRITYVDRDRFERILFTLIGNALRFTLNGYVRISLHYEGSRAVLAVEDTGVGIPRRDLEILGLPFWGDIGKKSNAHEGSGPALLYAKKLVQLHCGTISIDSRTAQESSDGSHGSIFTVTLPLGFAHLPPECVMIAMPSDGSALKAFHLSVLQDISISHWGWVGSTSKVDRRPPTSEGFPIVAGINPDKLWFQPTDVVLIVDDLLDTRKYIRHIFEPFCTTQEARDGVEALEKVKERVPDLIIADTMLPRMDGVRLLEALRTGTHSEKLVPVILLTSQGSALSDGAFGADDYISKPFNARELIARAHMQLQLGKKRQMLEVAYRQRSSELQVLTDNMPVGIFRTNDEGVISYANREWYELTGYPPTIAITNWGDYVVDEHREKIGAMWSNYVASDQETVQGEFQWKTGRWVNCLCMRLKPIEGVSPGIIGCVMDITDRKLSEELQQQRVVEAETRRAEAEEAKRLQEELIDITSHEIRNPISSIMGLAAIMRANLTSWRAAAKDSLDRGQPLDVTPQLLADMDEDLQALDNIHACGLTQERISNDVLSLGKLSLDKLAMFDVETDIFAETAKVMSVFRNEAALAGVKLGQHLGPNLHAIQGRLMLDPVRFGQVVTNLLSNAIRFTSTSHTRKVDLCFDIGLTRPPDGSCVQPADEAPLTGPLAPGTRVFLFGSVSDTGPGMSAAEKASLFQRFSQASAKTHTVFGGSGLGLFVCRKIAVRMDGEIDVVSEPGQGSRFQFFVAARTPPALSAAVRAPALPPRAALVARVLVVEDNIINRTVVLRQMKQAGLHAEAVTNGLEALERLRASQDTPQRFDCVLMDLEMPVMDGYTATKCLRAEEAARGKGCARTSVVALTGNARQAMIQEAMSDFDEVAVKPYRLDALLGKIAKVMAASEARAASAASERVDKASSDHCSEAL